MTDLVSCLADQNFSSSIKVLDAAIHAALSNRFEAVTIADLYVNRAFCNQKLNLYRAALKDYEAAVNIRPNHVLGLYRQGQLLAAMKKPKEAATSWTKALSYACSTTDVTVVMDIIRALKAVDAVTGVKLLQAPVPTPTPESNPAQPALSKGSAPPASMHQSDSSIYTSSAATSQAPPPSDVVLNATVAVQLAVTQINSGRCSEAETLLDQVLKGTPREFGALVARGTARALQSNFKGAVDDFSTAIEVEPRYADSYKRRGQARSAIGELDGAMADLSKAAELMKMYGQDTPSSRAEVLLERGMIQQKRRDYRRAVLELRACVEAKRENPAAWNILGLVVTSMGDLRDGVEAYRTAVSLDPKMKEAWMNMAQALKEEGRVKEAEKAFQKVFALDDEAAPSVGASRVMAQMRQQCGEHDAAIAILDKVLPHARDEQMIELLFLRAICHHALGALRDAVHDYEAVLAWTKGAAPSEEARSMQYLSFYQKEIALYTAAHIDRPVAAFCMDAELPALFKELWCKKGPPTDELIMTYRAQPPLPSTRPTPPPRTAAEKLGPLTTAADAVGVLLQNHHQGFLPNVRQQRAAGYAAVELGQAVSALVAARRMGNDVWVNSEGSSSQAGTAGRHRFGWRDAMDLVVKWRQLAEPNDKVLWVDLLTKREFEQGFGNHTPMFMGQTKCVRYYMNFKRAMALAKQVLLRDGHATDASNRPVPLGSESARDAIQAAETAEDLYKVIGTDSWVVVPIASTCSPGRSLKGTRLTLVRVPDQPDAYEFSIRTPVTPPRWRDFDAELEAAWEAVLGALVAGADGPTLAPLILAYAYYWYNFMPLVRGTAACGYTTLLALFWVAGMPVTAPIPKDYQVDWEAILAQDPVSFITAVSSWLYPAAARAPAIASDASSAASSLPPLSSLPPAAEVLCSMHVRIEALNGESGRRVSL